MNATWHKASGAILDRDAREGTVSVFWDYDLGRWSFGFRFEHDDSWYDFHIDLGPANLSFCYWRTNDYSSAYVKNGDEG